MYVSWYVSPRSRKDSLLLDMSQLCALYICICSSLSLSLRSDAALCATVRPWARARARRPLAAPHISIIGTRHHWLGAARRGSTRSWFVDAYSTAHNTLRFLLRAVSASARVPARELCHPPRHQKRQRAARHRRRRQTQYADDARPIVVFFLHLSKIKLICTVCI